MNFQLLFKVNEKKARSQNKVAAKVRLFQKNVKLVFLNLYRHSEKHLLKFALPTTSIVLAGVLSFTDIFPLYCTFPEKHFLLSDFVVPKTALATKQNCHLSAFEYITAICRACQAHFQNSLVLFSNFSFYSPPIKPQLN